MLWIALAAATVGQVPAPPRTAADAVRAAAEDVRRLDAETAAFTKYLSAHHVPDAELADAYTVTAYQVNALSRVSPLKKPRAVRPWLWAVDIRDYGWSPFRFGNLVWGKGPFAVEPYFHVLLAPASDPAAKKKTPAAAPWLPKAAAGELLLRANSAVPIVRYDWFLHRTAVQEGRGESAPRKDDGFGYYDFLELKSRKDAEDLAGLDRRKAEQRSRELGAVVAESGVALQPRQLFWFNAVTGDWWESRDVKAETGGQGDKNARRLLLGDFKHDAEEIVFRLPNRLPGYYLSDAAGKGANFAPPEIAADGKSRSNDKRVHAGLSCVRCHAAGGLIPFDDLMRRQFAAGDGEKASQALNSPDKALLRRLESVYLGPIGEAFDRGVEESRRAFDRACGLKPAELSARYAGQWSRYADEPVTMARAAAEVGLTEAEFASRLTGYVAGVRQADALMAGLAADPPIPLTRGQFEELYPLLMDALKYPGGGP